LTTRPFLALTFLFLVAGATFAAGSEAPALGDDAPLFTPLLAAADCTDADAVSQDDLFSPQPLPQTVFKCGCGEAACLGLDHNTPCGFNMRCISYPLVECPGQSTLNCSCQTWPPAW